jgi:hypothetical protein
MIREKVELRKPAVCDDAVLLRTAAFLAMGRTTSSCLYHFAGMNELDVCWFPTLRQHVFLTSLRSTYY